MKGQVIVAGLIGWMAISAAIALGPTGGFAAEAENRAEGVEATPPLIREVQFMLVRLGMDPGSIDGIVGPLTTNAVHRFQAQYGLPVTELVNDGRISAQLLSRIRGEAARAILGNAKPEAGPPPAVPAAASPKPTVTPPQPLPPPNRFAACPYEPADFRIGGTQYTPDKFLQDGFEGSTMRAVASLKDRLTEARQLAENIGGSALAEVQRQARVLAYFSCRLKIEQAAGGK